MQIQLHGQSIEMSIKITIIMSDWDWDICCNDAGLLKMSQPSMLSLDNRQR